MINNIGIYAKAIAGAAVAAGTAAITALSDGHVDVSEWIALASTFLVALGAVWRIPNLPRPVARYGKAITAGVVAVLGSVATSIVGDGLDPAAWIHAAIALLSGLGLTAVVPNAVASEEFGGDDLLYDDLEEYDDLEQES